MASRSTIRIKPKPLPEDSFLGNFLDPLDRLEETLFALMIMLSFTLAIRFSLLESGSHAPVSPEYVDKLVIMMLSAIVGWGTIDGILYALLSVFDRGEKQRLFVRIQTAATPDEGIEAIAEKLDPILEPITRATQRQLLYEDVLAHLSDSRPKPVGIRRDDLIGAVGCVLVAVISVLPSLAVCVSIPPEAPGPAPASVRNEVGRSEKGCRSAQSIIRKGSHYATPHSKSRCPRRPGFTGAGASRLSTGI